MVSLLLQQTLVVARDLGGQLLFSLRQEIHPGLTLLEEALLLENHRLQFTGEGPRKVTSLAFSVRFRHSIWICHTI